MNQNQIGRFIAECRKEKGLTQSQIAEHFDISNRAVSKWETGKCLPDASIMIELCDLLGITVNELLSGERMQNMENYQLKAEENMVSLTKQLDTYKKRMMIQNIFLMLVVIVSVLSKIPPIAIVFIVGVMVFRNYYLLKNMNHVKDQMGSIDSSSGNKQ